MKLGYWRCEKNSQPFYCYLDMYGCLRDWITSFIRHPKVRHRRIRDDILIPSSTIFFKDSKWPLSSIFCMSKSWHSLVRSCIQQITSVSQDDECGACWDHSPSISFRIANLQEARSSSNIYRAIVCQVEFLDTVTASQVRFSALSLVFRVTWHVMSLNHLIVNVQPSIAPRRHRPISYNDATLLQISSFPL